jgi:hypothetical protein
MKEILDKFLLPKSLEAVKIILALFERLRNQEYTLFDILTALQIDFDHFATENKAEAAATWKVTTTAKAVERGTA